MRIKVLSVDEPREGERPCFEFVNQQGAGGICRPSLRFILNNSSFTVKPGDVLVVGDFIPDLITGQVMPMLVPEFIQRIIDTDKARLENPGGSN
jgi:hypothetical protein